MHFSEASDIEIGHFFFLNRIDRSVLSEYSKNFAEIYLQNFLIGHTSVAPPQEHELNSDTTCYVTI